MLRMTIMTTKLKLKIVTPERVLFESDVASVTCPTTLGEITILPNHIPLASSLVPGEIRFRDSGEEKFLASGGGVVEVKATGEVVILADSAEAAHEIDVARAEQAKVRAQKIMSEKILSDEEYATTAASLEKSLARLRVARRRKQPSRHADEI